MQISGNGTIAPHLSKLYGIRNGIDPELWDPEHDPFLPMSYNHESSIQVRTRLYEFLYMNCGHSDDKLA